MKKLKVLVLTGGESSEREISLMTGDQVVKNLDRDKYDVDKVEMGEKGWLDKVLWSEVVFIAMHGAGGEDGRIQGFLDIMGKKYTGSGVEASVVGMDKMIFRALMDKFEVLMPKQVTKSPCVVKPINQGSSVGVSMVTKQKDLIKAVKKAEKYGQLVIEEYVKGVEVSCGVLGGQVMPVIEICPKNGFFDYEAKYSDGKCEEVVPARISEEMTKRVQKLALRVFEVVGCRGFGRVDMIIRDEEIYVLEINTIPGLTRSSLLPKEAKAMGINYPQLLDKIIELAFD